MLTTRFTELVGCTVPIQQAGMGLYAHPPLAKAVANAGGLGMVSVYSHYGGSPDNIARLLDTAQDHSSGAIGANFIMHGVDPALAEESVAAAAARVRVVDFFYSNPDPALVDIVHTAGALVSWQVGSPDEALAAVDAGCDFIIAQGAGAGGHVRGTVSLLPLLDEVLEAVDVPVLASGGIGSGRTMAAVLAAGADGVRVGTRFIAAEEPEAHPIYVEALIAAQAQDTIVTQAFNVGDWPVEYEAIRVLRSSLEAAQAFESEIVGEDENPWTGEHYTMRRFVPDAITKAATGHIEAMPHLAGESVGSVKQVQTAAEIIEELMSQAEELLGRWR